MTIGAAGGKEWNDTQSERQQPMPPPSLPTILPPLPPLALGLLVLDPLHFDIISNELIDIRDHCGGLDVHQYKGWDDVAVRKHEKSGRSLGLQTTQSIRFLRDRIFWKWISRELFAHVPFQCVVGARGWAGVDVELVLVLKGLKLMRVSWDEDVDVELDRKSVV